MSGMRASCARGRRGPSVVLCVVALLLLLITATTTSFAAAPSETTVYYGQLRMPHDYFTHPTSRDTINWVQPASVLLVNKEHTIRVPVQRDGSFVAYHVPYGVYLLQAEYHDFIFPTVRVSVQHKVQEDGRRVPVIRTISNEYPEEPLEGTGTSEESPAVIPAVSVHQYFIPREEFSLMDIVKNPMVIMLCLSCGMLFMARMVPEEDRKEAERRNREWTKNLVKKANAVQSGAPAQIKSTRK